MTTDWTARFADSAWPFLGRDELLADALDFLSSAEIAGASRQLDIVGPSGIGKSLFAKELILRFTDLNAHSICLYINVEQSEFESAEIEKQLLALYSHARTPTREDPCNVPDDVVPRGWKALPREKRRDPDGWLWDHLFGEAEARPVLLAIDNVQFLADSVRGELERVLPAAATGFRLVAIERLLRTGAARRGVTCFPHMRKGIALVPLSLATTRELVKELLGDEAAAPEHTADALYAASHGNPKQLWIQLRAMHLKRRSGSTDITVGDYEDTIRQLPVLEILALRVVTFLEGGLKVDDLVQALRSMIEPLENAEEKIRKTVVALTVIGLLVINSSSHDRVRPEHELVKLSVRQLTSPEELDALRLPTIAALMQRLKRYEGDAEEFDRLADRLLGLVTPVEVARRADYRAHLIGLVERQYKKENYHYLSSLYPAWEELGIMLPRDTLLAFLDAFQKTSQFDEGIAAVEKLRAQRSPVPRDDLAIAEAKYLVQKFNYDGALTVLEGTATRSESEMLRMIVALNRCDDDAARSAVEMLSKDSRALDEFQCIMLRNTGHLYDAATARDYLLRARDGFERLGRKLGLASTLTNLGVVDLWDNEYARARSYLEDARGGLDAIASNEAYQPITNLAVLDALEGKYGSALRLLSIAERIVSRQQLAMDDLMLRFNRLVIEMMAGQVSVDHVESEARMIHRLSAENTLDYRFRETMAWFANEVTRVTGGLPVASEFEQRFRRNGCAGLEVFRDVAVQDHNVTAVLILSPHWRY